VAKKKTYSSFWCITDKIPYDEVIVTYFFSGIMNDSGHIVYWELQFENECEMIIVEYFIQIWLPPHLKL
jgi:hypothetical protein